MNTFFSHFSFPGLICMLFPESQHLTACCHALVSSSFQDHLQEFTLSLAFLYASWVFLLSPYFKEGRQPGSSPLRLLSGRLSPGPLPIPDKQQLPSKFPVLKGAVCWQGLQIWTPPSHTLNFISGYKIPTSCFVILVLSICFKNKPFVVSTRQSLSVQSLTMHLASSRSLLKLEQRLPCAWQEWLLVLKTAKMQSKALHPAEWNQSCRGNRKSKAWAVQYVLSHLSSLWKKPNLVRTNCSVQVFSTLLPFSYS